MTGSVGRRLRRLLGIDERLLARTSDATYYTLMVGMALVIAIVASLFMTNAVLYALGPRSWPAAVAGGIVWGALVLLIDLSVLLPEPYVEPEEHVTDVERGINRHRRAKVAVRVVVAVAIGYLIAEPLMATLFRRDVNAELPTAQEAYALALDDVGDQAAAEVNDSIANRRELRDAAQAAYDEATADADGLQEQCASDPQFCQAFQVARDTAGREGNQANFQEGAIIRLEKDREDAIEAAKAEFRADNPLDERDYGPASLGAWDRFAKTHELLGGWIWVVSGAIVLIDTMVVSLKLLKGVTDYERELGAEMTRIQDEARSRRGSLVRAGLEYHEAEAQAQAHASHTRRMERLGVAPLPPAPPPRRAARPTGVPHRPPVTEQTMGEPTVTAAPISEPPGPAPAVDTTKAPVADSTEAPVTDPTPAPAPNGSPDDALAAVDAATAQYDAAVAAYEASVAGLASPTDPTIDLTGAEPTVTTGSPADGPATVIGETPQVMDLSDVGYLHDEDNGPEPAAVNGTRPSGPSGSTGEGA